MAVVQAETPQHLIGKVVACIMTFIMCVQPIGQLLYGFLFECLPSQPVIIIGASMISLVIAVRSKKILIKLGGSTIMTNTAVEIRNLTKVFDGKEVLRSCNLTVQSGTIYGLLGANGAGKTTMFKLITGLLSPTAGNIKVQGETLSIDKKTS